MGSHARFNAAIQKCVRLYFESGPRSSDKLRPLHYFVNQSIRDVLPGDYEIVSYVDVDGDVGKEETVRGIFNDKKVDVAVKKNGKVRGVVSVKFVMSNYGQNSNNYFESMLGECQNLKLYDPGIVFWYFFVVMESVPYFTKDGRVKRWEKSRKEEILDKHGMLLRLFDKSQTPDCVSVSFVTIDPSITSEWARTVADPVRISEACSVVDGEGPLLWSTAAQEFVNLLSRS